MTRNNKNNSEKMNNRNNFRIEPQAKSATDKAREAAAREDERAARKAAREREQKLASKFDELTMTPNDALRTVAAHAKDELEDGFTVGDYMAAKGLKKLDIKALRKALPQAFVREDGIYMPATNAAVYDSAPEDPRNGKAVYYCVTKGKGESAHKIWKKAQTYGLVRVELWTPATVRRILSAGMTYEERVDGYKKRNDEVKNCKQFYVLNERTESTANGKVNRKTVVENYVAIDKANVKFAE